MKKLLSVLMALLLTVSCLTACGDDEEEEISIYFPVAEDFGSMDPQIVDTASSSIVTHNCFEGLVTLSAQGEILPGGASSWSVSDDGLTYTFHLRPGAKWYLTNSSKDQIGEALPEQFDDRVTAKDFVFGLQRAIDPLTGSAERRYLAAVHNAGAVETGKAQLSSLGLAAPDDQTVVITLDYADPDFLFALTRNVAMPCNEVFFDACGGRYGMTMEYVLCNGPYIMYSWTEGSNVHLEKNPLYVGEHAPVNSTVWVYYVKDAATIPQKLIDGVYDAACVPSGQASAIKADRTLDLHERNDIIWCYWFNCSVEQFRSVNMRMAFASSVKKELITLPENAQQRVNRLLPDYCIPHYDFSPADIPYDEAAAAAYYQLAKGENANLTGAIPVTVLTCTELEASVRKQIQVWQRVLGLDVKIRVESREDAESMLRSGNYEVAFLPLTVNTNGTTDFFKRFVTGAPYNVVSYKNENYDAQIASITEDLSADEKTKKYKECEQTLISHAVAVPVFVEASYFARHAGVSGIDYISDEEIYFATGVSQ